MPGNRAAGTPASGRLQRVLIVFILPLLHSNYLLPELAGAMSPPCTPASPPPGRTGASTPPAGRPRADRPTLRGDAETRGYGGPTSIETPRPAAQRPYAHWSNAELRAAFVPALAAVEASSDALFHALGDPALRGACWLWAPPGADGAATTALWARARAIITNYRYREQEPRRGKHEPDADERAATRLNYACHDLAPGVIAAPASWLTRARTFNADRETLEPLLLELNHRSRKVTAADDRSGVHVGQPLGRYVLRSLGRNDLHLHRIRRRLVVLDAPPVSINFLWATLRRIRRVDPDTLILRLTRLRGAVEDDPRVGEDLAILQAVREHAHRQGVAPTLAHITAPHRHPKANIRLRTAATPVPASLADTTRIQRVTLLPIFYPGAPEAPLIRVRPLPPLPPDAEVERLYQESAVSPRGRLRRSDLVYDHLRQLLRTLPVYAHRDIVDAFGRRPARASA